MAKENVQVVHRPGPLKQSNKPHKGGRGKSNKNEKGKIGVKAISHNSSHSLRRKERRHKANQIRKNKRDAVLSKKRGLGAADSPPLLVAIVPLSPSVNPSHLLERIKECDEDVKVSCNDQGHCYIGFLRQKQRFTFFIPKVGDLHCLMDAAKVANTFLFIHSPEELDQYTEMLLSTILVHSYPSTVHIMSGLGGLNPKKKAEVKREVMKKMESRFPNEKLMHADTKQELQLLLRHIGCQKQRNVGFRDVRPHLLADKIEYINDDDKPTGRLLVSGYVRGQPLSVNSLVHIPGWGDFQMLKIVYGKDIYPLVDRKKKPDSNSSIFQEEKMMDDLLLSEVADPSQQELLCSEVIPDPMQCEQTWPSEEELQESAFELKKNVDVKRVVEGTSEYQAAWIVDSDGEKIISSDESEEASDADSVVTAPESFVEDHDDDDIMQSEESEDEHDFAMTEENGDPNKYDEDINMEEEKKMLVRFREERMEHMFPDEQDTPADVPARIRYQKYRGLKSFTDSPWDPMENLPPDYARIYRFENFKQTRKTVLSAEKEGALPGLYVTLHINEVPRSLYDEVTQNNLLVVYGLLRHEQKMSVVNVVIRKHHFCQVPIKSKDTLIFHVGFRRFVCQPIFSVHSTGNKFKYERFLPSNAAVVASFFAPIMFQPASVVVFQQHPNGHHELVATGSLLNVDPNRVVVKRVVLSGHPFKIFRRSAVIRYMFFNREDINWFKCIELRTKCGRKGHIKEALGSHGHMKCVFNRQLQSQDVALMSLYKRIFPKWTYNHVVPTPVSPYEENENMNI